MMVVTREALWKSCRAMKPGLTKKQFSVIWNNLFDAVEKRRQVRQSMRLVSSR